MTANKHAHNDMCIAVSLVWAYSSLSLMMSVDISAYKRLILLGLFTVVTYVYATCFLI